tara:strand:- start:126 stop:803 length:678 start_codon:yes stop_codon:yes gene_type:complete
MSSIYYTYAYLRKDKTPYYIGKGKDNRAYRKRKNGIKSPKDKSRIILLKQNLTEEEAFKHEKYMIAVFGRKDLGTGILHNRTDGGDGASGTIVTEETREKLRTINLGKQLSDETKRKIGNSGKGKVHTKETKRKMSRNQIGENNSFYGKSHSDLTKQKIAVASENRIVSDETKRKMSEAQKGDKNHNYGKPAYNKGKPMSEEQKKKISAAKKGKMILSTEHSSVT